MSDEHKLEGMTYICVSRQMPRKDPTNEKEEIEVVDMGLLIENDGVDWDRYDGERKAKVTFVEEKETGIKIPFIKRKKKKVETTVEGIRKTKNAELVLKNVGKQDIVDAAVETIGQDQDVPLTIDVYYNVGQYDLDDIQSALSIREVHKGINSDLQIIGWTKEVNGKDIVFTGEAMTAPPTFGGNPV